MGTAAVPHAAALVMGVLWTRDDALARARDLVEDAFGPVDGQSSPFPFDPFTAYYAAEMGIGIMRCLWSFERPVPRGSLAELKLSTNRAEMLLAEGGRRTVNLDPGILSVESFVLGTTKPFSHRVYLAKGIYAEVTLVHRKGGYEPLPWTYPDYRDPGTIAFLGEVRRRMMSRKGTWRADRPRQGGGHGV